MKLKKLLCFALALAMALCLLPSAGLAASDAWDGTVDISWYDPDATEYHLSTPAQLAGLAALVNGMTDPTCPKVIGDTSYLVSIKVDNVMLVGAGGGNVSDTIYVSPTDFAGKTVYLDADMDMGGTCVNGVWEGPNWTPIGGKFPMKPNEVDGDCITLETVFNGVLDGQGHTVSNIYCQRYAKKGFPYSMAVGLVGYLGGHSEYCETAAEPEGWIPTVRNVVVGQGYILGRRMVGGVVGRTDEQVLIENCANYAEIHNTDAKGIGGICGSAWGGGVIRNCYNVGTVTTTYSDCAAGGIVGSNDDTSIYNCYTAAKISGVRSRDIGSHDSGIYTVSNCYYLEGMSDDAASNGYYVGTSKRLTINITSMTEAQMKSGALVSALNTSGNVFVADKDGINNGYPILWFQADSASGKGTACSVSAAGAKNGTVSVSASSAKYGDVVTFSCEPEAGYTLDHYVVNGTAISTDFYTVTGNTTVTAEFKLLGKGTITIPESQDYYVAVSRQGTKLVGDTLTYVYDDVVNTGDTIYEGNILKIMVYGYEDAVPEDMNLEYIDAFSFTVPGCVKNSDDTYTYGGSGDISIEVSRTTRQKQWINLADTSWYSAAAPESSYTLTTPEQLAGLAYLVNKSGVTFAGITISLGNDISLANTDGTTGSRCWTPIGSNASKTFSGTFDGCGYSIYGMEVSSSSSYAGFFGVATGASIQNLSVYGSVESSANSSYAGGLAAYLDSCTVDNCLVYADVAASGNYAGGITAYLTNGTSMNNCFCQGNVTGKSGIGGIAGVSDGSADAIISCASFGSVISTGNATYGTGGIIGKLVGSVTSSASYCTISGSDRYTGGIAGYTAGKASSVLTDCAFYGTAETTSSTATTGLGSVVGYAQFLTIAGGTSTDSSLPLIGRSGKVTTKTSSSAAPTFRMPAEKTFASAHGAPYTITFVADGKTVSSIQYSSTSDRITLPAVPEKEGCVGYWEPYSLGSADLTVNAVYRQNLVRGGDTITADGTYYIAWFSSGELSIADGAKVKLIGDDGPFSSLHITTGKGTSLTLKNVEMESSSTMLTLGYGTTLTLEGQSTFSSSSELMQNGGVALRITGNAVIDGNGSLWCNACKGNACCYVSTPGSVVELKGGTLLLYKDTLLGFEGGAFYAPDSELRVSGGTIRATTDDDNVRAIYSSRITMSSGEIIAQTLKSPVSIEGTFTATGGTLSAYGHTGNNAESNQKALPGLESVSGYSGKAAMKDILPFSDVYASDPYYDAIYYCWEHNLFAGTGSDKFEPSTSMTRSMFVMVLYKLAGSPKVSGTTPFKDLTQSWYKDAVTWAVQNGITSGTSATTFSPSVPVSRQQAAVFLQNYAAFAKASLPADGGEDVSVGNVASWAKTAVSASVSAGLFDGYSGALDQPSASAPRDLLAVVLQNYCTVS